MSSVIALLDACVLYPAPLRDLLMWLTRTGAYRARWTDEIHDEWTESLLRQRPDLSRDALRRTRELMNVAAPDAMVTDYEPWIDQLKLPDANDRHVLAAAIVGQADILVTFNLSDFPADVLALHDIVPAAPDPFVTALLIVSPEKVIEAARRHRASLKNPARTIDEYLSTLARGGLPVAAERLRQDTASI